MKWLFLSFAFVTIFGSLTADSLIPPPPGDICNGPVAGVGLGQAIREIVDIIPIETFLEIFMTWVTNDYEVMAAMEYFGGPEFTKIVTVMHNTPEFGEVMDFLCNQCYFDAYFYLNSLGGLFNFPPMQRPRSGVRMEYDGLTGFRGFMHNLADALPLDQVRNVYQHRLATDIYMQQAMAKISSDTFRTVGCRIQALPEYADVVSKLEGVGVDTDAVLGALFNFFNWPVNC